MKRTAHNIEPASLCPTADITLHQQRGSSRRALQCTGNFEMYEGHRVIVPGESKAAWET